MKLNLKQEYLIAMCWLKHNGQNALVSGEKIILI